ncbi:MAG TPA: TGS domain-containing protein [Planctomycetes bacterium]|nr:TGS domain-containing protein [Fuerstiella sp.]HIK91036.1 TGS domain-containing protein [Planctomycetota bacterium]
MPANLTPMYYKAERDYRRAQTVAEQVECLQLMLQLMPKHKGTDKLQAGIKSRLSEARQNLKQQINAPKSGQTFRIPRQGAGRIVIIGGPNCGKSRILKELTRAEPDVAPFPFTTREPLPAMMEYEGVQIQLVDTPPITAGQLQPWLLNLVRTADGVLLVFDGSSDEAPEETMAVIQELGSRKTRLTEIGGFDKNSFSIVNLASRLVVTHASDVDCQLRSQLLFESWVDHTLSIGVELGEEHFVSTLKQRCFELLKIIRVFTKAPGKPADMGAPLTIADNGTVEDLAAQIHDDLARNLKHARLWGHGDHDGQVVGPDYRLRDGDVVELHC